MLVVDQGDAATLRRGNGDGTDVGVVRCGHEWRDRIVSRDVMLLSSCGRLDGRAVVDVLYRLVNGLVGDDVEARGVIGGRRLDGGGGGRGVRSEEHTSELQSRQYLVCRLLLEKKKLMVF